MAIAQTGNLHVYHLIASLFKLRTRFNFLTRCSRDIRERRYGIPSIVNFVNNVNIDQRTPPGSVPSLVNGEKCTLSSSGPNLIRETRATVKSDINGDSVFLSLSRLEATFLLKKKLWDQRLNIGYPAALLRNGMTRIFGTMLA